MLPSLSALLCLAALPADNPVPRASGDFAVALYKQLAKDGLGKNLFFSPYSMFGALSMAAEGARGETAAQMAKALHYPAGLRDLTPIHAGIAALNERFTTKRNLYELAVANAVWVDKQTPIVKAYRDTVTAHYKAGLFDVDFRGDAEGARKEINEWSAKQTRGRIKEVLAEASPDARVVLANAVYLKCEWGQRFDPKETKKKEFLVNGRVKALVPTMYLYAQLCRYGAFEADGKPFDTPGGKSRGARYYPGKGGFQVLEMPYKCCRLSMLIVLPLSPDGLPAVEKALAGEKLREWVKHLTQRDVEVHLPKFRLERRSGMKDALEALGMPRAFDPGAAEFQGIRDTNDPRKKLHISGVLHRTFVEANEQGTEAAAVTEVEEFRGASPEDEEPQEPFTPTFQANHPFLFLIRDEESGTILFLGRVVDPGSR
jgi:serpin B